MFKEDFVVAIKDKYGNVLREDNQTVRLPFGSDYSLLLKNLKNRKAVVEVEIDGEDVLDDNRIIVDPNSTVELEGFMKNGKVRNKFRFIQKTKEIEKYRGNRVDDGVVRVEVTWEEKETKFNLLQPQVKIQPWIGDSTIQHWIDHNYPWYNYTIASQNDKDTMYMSSVSCAYSHSMSGSSTIQSRSINMSNISDDGITVKGEETRQDFGRGYTRCLENESVVITMILKGTTNGDKVTKPKLVKKKTKCPTCGKTSRSDVKFCPECGTYIKDE